MYPHIFSRVSIFTHIFYTVSTMLLYGFQGSAADIVMMAMIKLWKSQVLKDLGWTLLLQVTTIVFIFHSLSSTLHLLSFIFYLSTISSISCFSLFSLLTYCDLFSSFPAFSSFHISSFLPLLLPHFPSYPPLFSSFFPTSIPNFLYSFLLCKHFPPSIFFTSFIILVIQYLS